MNKLLLFTYLSLASAGLSATQSPTNVSELFGAPEVLDIIKSPERVDACVLVLPPTGEKYDFNTDDNDRYKETTFVPLTDNGIKILQTVLLDESTYVWSMSKGCIPIYHVRLRFHRRTHSVWVDFCFACKILAIAKDGQWFSGEDFDNGNNAILAVFASTFPNDSAFKAIKEDSDRREKEMQAHRRAIEEAKQLKKTKTP